MLTVPGQYILDAWFCIHERNAHCYFLTASESIPSDERWNHFDIGHAVSDDLVNWEYVGLALERGADNDWDGLGLATGSVIRRDGRFWMAYTAQRKNEEPKIWRIGMAVSDDLYHWTKYERNPVTEPDTSMYEWVSSGIRKRGNWNDPFLFETGQRVYKFMCARKKSVNPNARGTIGRASTTDMLNWQVETPIDVEPVAEEMEVPQIYQFHGRYYLVFCTVPFLLLDAFKQRYPNHEFYSADFSMVGPSPRGPFQIFGTGEIVPQAAGPVPYASHLIEWKGEWFLLGTVKFDDDPEAAARLGVTQKGEGNRYICEPRPVKADETGIHVVA